MAQETVYRFQDGVKRNMHNILRKKLGMRSSGHVKSSILREESQLLMIIEPIMIGDAAKPGQSLGPGQEIR